MYIVHQSDKYIKRKGCSIAFVIYHRDCVRAECDLFTWKEPKLRLFIHSEPRVWSGKA